MHNANLTFSAALFGAVVTAVKAQTSVHVRQQGHFEKLTSHDLAHFPLLKHTDSFLCLPDILH